MLIHNVAVLSLLLAGASAHGDPPFATYSAEITELNGSGVTAKAIVFAGINGTAGYGGFAEGLLPDLEAATCNATNGCGVHIHTGFSCENTTAQGGHYFVDPVMEDPWVEARYSSGADGKASFSGVVDIGSTDDIEGRAFLVHAEDGSRVGCGLLTKVDKYDLLQTETEPLADSQVAGKATVHKLGTGVCFFGYSKNLEPNLSSVLIDGPDCDAPNGCGGHIHDGHSCENSTTQGGHLYDADALDADPWKSAGYLSTDSDGMGYFTDCLETGETHFADHAFIVHASDGSRVSCGQLVALVPHHSPAETPMPSASSTSSPTSTPSSSPSMMNTLKLTTVVAMVIALAVGS